MSSRAAARRSPLAGVADGVLEAGLYVVVFGAALAGGASEPWARSWLWGAAVVLAVGLAVARRVDSDDATARRPWWRVNPVLLPGALFLAWALLVSVPGLPEGVAGLSPRDTAIGGAYVATALATSAVASRVFRRAEARRRFAASLVFFGGTVGFAALVQYAAGATRIYGHLEGRPGNIPFGPFWNRNHYASWALMIIPLALEGLTTAARPWTRAQGPFSVRSALVRLDRAGGGAVLWYALPLLPLLGSLVATTSRGGIAAFVASLFLAAVLAGGRGRGVGRSALAAVFVAVLALAWLGPERLGDRLVRLGTDSSARTSVWRASLAAARARPVAGTGLNTFPLAVSEWVVYPAAHNDYLQVLVETGVVGLGLALWAAGTALGTARRRPWLLAALAAPLLHALVEFAFQTPAVGLLFVTLAALGGAGGARKGGAA